MNPLSVQFAAMLDTPAAVLALDIAEANIARLQAACTNAGVSNRPHIKTHKSPEIMRLQMEAGAIGVTCQKLSEAEVMAQAGAKDILISYNVLGVAKHQRLRTLASQTTLTVCCDNETVVDGYARAMAGEALPLAVLVECDTGRARCGVTTPDAAVTLARYVAAHAELRFDGLLMYPPDGELQKSAEFLAEVRSGCARHGLDLRTVSSGGTPNWSSVGQLGETEYRAGTYVYNDRQMVQRGAATLADCALLVYATVVSCPEPGRVMLDAGSKTLTADLMGFTDYGVLLDYPGACLYKLAEEHGFVDVSDCTRSPVIGEVVRILPNHACPVSNLFDRLLYTRAGIPSGHITIAARGRVT